MIEKERNKTLDRLGYDKNQQTGPSCVVCEVSHEAIKHGSGYHHRTAKPVFQLEWNVEKLDSSADAPHNPHTLSQWPNIYAGQFQVTAPASRTPN